MAKRFNNLKSALKLLRPLSGTGDAVDLADTSALGFFQAVQAGKKKVEYGDRPEGSEPGSLVPYALVPFATPVNTAPKVLTALSKRSETGFSASGITAADANISKEAANLSAAVELVGFVAAKCTIRVVGSTTETKTSKLTGQKYKTKGGRSYTYPIGFGTGEAAKGFKDVKAAIVAKAKSNTRSLSFIPEIYR
ncbi:hypothetical protein [Fortiea contorta]|uniref:hypothetical protein n=1 Tax=Fortiea contorta TaxID=1892405 RepID=UPI00034D8D80|nr:hypothetical protein [Fortiea contorta]